MVKRLKFEKLKKLKQKSDNLNGGNARTAKKKSEQRSVQKKGGVMHIV